MARKSRSTRKQGRVLKKPARSGPLIRQQAVAQLRDAPLKDDLLQEIVRRIVEVAKPEKIILFGSAAKGEIGPNSDVDLLVIKKGKYHRGRLTEKIYMNMFGVGQAVDVVVVTPEDVERYKDSFALVIYPALREGKVVYAA
jgi:predicted nucleotidyltransferase